jgi:hypothetical protein
MVPTYSIRIREKLIKIFRGGRKYQDFQGRLVKQCETDSRNWDQMVLFIFCREPRKLHPHVLV